MKLGFPVVSTSISRALNNQNESVGTNMVPVEHHKQQHDSFTDIFEQKTLWTSNKAAEYSDLCQSVAIQVKVRYVCFLTLRRTLQSRTLCLWIQRGSRIKVKNKFYGFWPIKNKAASFPPKARCSLVHCVCQKSPDAPQNLCRCLHKHTLINDWWRTRRARGTDQERWWRWKRLTMSQSFWTRPGRKAQIRWQKLPSSPSPKVLQGFPVQRDEVKMF